MINYFRTLVLLFLTSSFVQAQINVAVIDFLAKGVSKTDASIIVDKFRNSIVNIDSLKVFEREMVSQVLAEQGLQQSGVISDESAVELGKMIGVGQIVTGSVSNLNETYTLTAKVIDVKTGEILKSASIDHKGRLDGLLDQTDMLAQKLFGNAPTEDRSLAGTTIPTQGYTLFQLAFINPVQLFSETTAVTGLSINLIYGKKQSVYGIDVGVGNTISQELYGIQAGLINKSKKVVGLQAGLVNMTETMFGLQVGLINMIKSGPFPFLPFVNFGISL
jgi:TolB-like protein